MSGSPGGSFSTVPNGRIVEFETAELRRTPFPDTLHLCVRGWLPEGCEVRLAPRIYDRRPDYWGIEVAAITSRHPADDAGAAGDALVFERSVPLAGITGNRGISVIGANKVQRIDIDGESF